MLALIGGSGFPALPGLRERTRLAGTNRYGNPSAALHLGEWEGQALLFLARHGEPHRIPPHAVNYRANLRALADAGATAVLALNTVGGISAGCGTGTLCVPDDLIDYSWGRAHTFADGEAGTPLQHVDFTGPFCAGLRRQLLVAAAAAGVACRDGGVYAVAQGPRLETAAEIRRMERDGCDVVGMTAMPEAGLARELGLPYAMLCVVVNAAAGKAGAPLDTAAMAAVQARASGDVLALLAAFIRQAAAPAWGRAPGREGACGGHRSS